ncbi:XRE family transcriptional regulator [Rhizobium leguminosarum]|uniref:XRE family transcriptional regulator n=1 Tax=Rhizobium leguminosarum TaxID=384 RepID=UPI003F97B2A5
MENDLANRVRARMEELGLAPETVSNRMGMDRSYLRKLLSSRQSPKITTLSKLAGALDVSVNWLATGKDDAAPSQGNGNISQEIQTTSQVTLPKDVPVLGTAAGSHLRGAFQIEGGVVDYVRRPPALAGTKDIYALYVEGTSMEPQYAPGDLVYIHPHKPPRVGDAVIVQARSGEHGAIEATIGIYRRQTAEDLTLGKHNPAAEVKIPRRLITVIHKVLTLNELFGA